MAIYVTQYVVVQANSICIWDALHPSGRVFLQRKYLGLHYDLNRDCFSTTHNLVFPGYVCLIIKLNLKEDLNLHGILS